MQDCILKYSTFYCIRRNIGEEQSLVSGDFWTKSPIFNQPIIGICIHVCDIRQYLIHQNVFCTISPKLTFRQ